MPPAGPLDPTGWAGQLRVAGASERRHARRTREAQAEREAAQVRLDAAQAEWVRSLKDAHAAEERWQQDAQATALQARAGTTASDLVAHMAHGQRLRSAVDQARAEADACHQQADARRLETAEAIRQLSARRVRLQAAEDTVHAQRRGLARARELVQDLDLDEDAEQAYQSRRYMNATGAQ